MGLDPVEVLREGAFVPLAGFETVKNKLSGGGTGEGSRSDDLGDSAPAGTLPFTKKASWGMERIRWRFQPFSIPFVSSSIGRSPIP